MDEQGVEKCMGQEDRGQPGLASVEDVNGYETNAANTRNTVAQIRKGKKWRSILFASD